MAPHCSCVYICLFTFEILAPFFQSQKFSFPFLSLGEWSVNQGRSRWFILRVGILHLHADNVICIVCEIAIVCLKVRFDKSGEWAGACSKVPLYPSKRKPMWEYLYGRSYVGRNCKPIHVCNCSTCEGGCCTSVIPPQEWNLLWICLHLSCWGKVSLSKNGFSCQTVHPFGN